MSMAIMTSAGCPIRWCSPFTSHPIATRSFSSSFFAIGSTSEISSSAGDCDRFTAIAAFARRRGTGVACKEDSGDALRQFTTLNLSAREDGATLLLATGPAASRATLTYKTSCTCERTNRHGREQHECRCYDGQPALTSRL